MSPVQFLPTTIVFYDEKNTQNNAIYIDELGHIYRRQKNKQINRMVVTTSHLNSKWLNNNSLISENDRTQFYEQLLKSSDIGSGKFNIGRGKFIYISGETFDGDWDYFFNTANGVYTKGTLRYEGSMRHDNCAFDGHGVYTEGSMTYRGSFTNGKLNGVGTLINNEQTKQTYCLGKFMDDEFTSGAKYTKTRNNGEISQIIELGKFLGDMDNNIKIEIDAINEEIKVTQKINPLPIKTDINLQQTYRIATYIKKQQKVYFLEWLLNENFNDLNRSAVGPLVNLFLETSEAKLPAWPIEDNEIIRQKFNNFRAVCRAREMLGEPTKDHMLIPKEPRTAELSYEEFQMQYISLSTVNKNKLFDELFAIFQVPPGKVLSAGSNRGETYLLGCIYYSNGKIGPARTLFLKASEQNEPNAQNNLGSLCAKQENLNQAIEYYTMAAKQGHSNAQNSLGVIYIEKNNREEAIVYFTMAANQGNMIAQYNLGIIYNKENNREEAIVYFTMAANQGHIKALDNLKVLSRRDKIEQKLHK